LGIAWRAEPRKMAMFHAAFHASFLYAAELCDAERTFGVQARGARLSI